MINPHKIPRDRPSFAAPDRDDILELAANLRPLDRAELHISTLGLHPEHALALAVAASDHTLAARLDGRLVAIFGIRADSLLDRTAVIWALGTRELERRPRPFIRWSPRALAVLADTLPWAETLVNAVWTLNLPAARWLGWLGASFGHPYSVQAVHPYGPQECTFTPFSIERSSLCVRSY